MAMNDLLVATLLVSIYGVTSCDGTYGYCPTVEQFKLSKISIGNHNGGYECGCNQKQCSSSTGITTCASQLSERCQRYKAQCDDLAGGCYYDEGCQCRNAMYIHSAGADFAEAAGMRVGGGCSGSKNSRLNCPYSPPFNPCSFYTPENFCNSQGTPSLTEEGDACTCTSCNFGFSGSRCKITTTMTTTTTTTISSTTTTEACNGKGDPVVCAKSYSYPDDCEDPVKGKDVSESCPILCRSCIEETTTTTTEAQTTNAATTATTTIMLEARDGKKSGGTVAGVLVPLLLIGILVGVWWFHFKGNANAYGRWMDAPPAHLATANDQDGNNVPALSDITLVLNPEDNHGASESSTDDLPAGSMPNAWFVGTMKKDECKAHVAAAKKYEFLVRGSSSVKDGYSVCINMDGAADVRLHLVKRGPNGKFGVPFCSDEFSQIQSFIQHWQTNTLTPKAGETFSLGGAAPHGSSKFIAPAIQLGASTLSATPLAEVMGVDPKIFYVNDKIKAMRDEFEKYGTQEDNNNLAGLIDETYRNPGCDPDDPPGFAFLSA
eukprot:gene12085-24046_t